VKELHQRQDATQPVLVARKGTPLHAGDVYRFDIGKKKPRPSCYDWMLTSCHPDDVNLWFLSAVSSYVSSHAGIYDVKASSSIFADIVIYHCGLWLPSEMVSKGTLVDIVDESHVLRVRQAMACLVRNKTPEWVTEEQIRAETNDEILENEHQFAWRQIHLLKKTLSA